MINLMKSVAYFLLVCLFLLGCQQSQKTPSTVESTGEQVQIGNPAAPGFDSDNSDQQAIDIADQVMEAMGGRANWDKTRMICWTFFGFRQLIWDKWEGNVRIDVPRDDLTILMNIHDNNGRVKKGGEEMTNPDSLRKYLERGKGIWINDSYWLVMPYKLKDSGVTLKYLGEENTEDGRSADVLGLTFNDVGNTPQNRYKVCVDKESRLVLQWEFFRNAEDDSSSFITPWKDYSTYGKILLSGNRGERELSDIRVWDSLPSSVFSSFDPVDYQNL